MDNSLTNNQEPAQPPKRSSFVLPSKFKVRLEMKSDWHVGTGAGRPGSIDKLLARDSDGFPFVPAKTVNGIWRDAMETLTLGLDNGGKDANGEPKYEWQRFVELIFGNQPALPGADPTIKPFSSILKIQPARLSENLRGKIDAVIDSIADKEEWKQQRQKLLSVLTFIKPGVAIDEKTGTAITDFLRFEEMGRVGTVIEAECTLSETNETISAMLLLSAKLVERIGGKRRRGAGLCVLKVCDENGKEIDAKDAIDWLDKNRTATDVSLPSNEGRKFSLDKEANDSAWQSLEFSLKLQTPVSIATATLGNVSESLDYIPGTYLLPHVTKVLREKLGNKVFQAVAYGDLQVLPATIEINGKRGLPVPRVLAQRKVEGGFDKQGTLYNKFAKETTDKQLKPFRLGYVQALESVESGKDKLPSYKYKAKTLLMHNTVKDDIQRPHEDVGGVYSREAIAAGTILRGEIRLRKSLADELGANWWVELNGYLRLGTSRKDDYGLAELSVSQPKPFSSSSTRSVNRLTVYLLSDCLLRNSNLRQTNLVENLAEELSKKENLNVQLRPVKSSDKETTSLVTARRIESWHEGWGFPRPTLIAMEAGSCVVFEVNEDLTQDKLHEVEAIGIGERRGEGYGQVRFNPPLLTQEINGWEKADPPDETRPPILGSAKELSDEEKRFAELIEETAWREELKVAALKIADDLENRKRIFGFDSNERTPPMSQIGGLRSAISRLKSKSDATIVTGWLDHLKETENRRKKWSEDKKKAEGKINRIRELITQDSKVWLILCETKIEGISVWQSPPTLVRSKDQLQQTFWAEAIRALFDACARAHKREIEKKEND